MTGHHQILVVDDDRLFCSLFKEGLSLHGYDCEMALGGESALALIRQRPFDLLVTDVVMPGMDGFELSRKAAVIKPDLLIVVVTGCVTADTRRQARLIGAADFIEKPFELDELASRIAVILKNRVVPSGNEARLTAQ